MIPSEYWKAVMSHHIPSHSHNNHIHSGYQSEQRNHFHGIGPPSSSSPIGGGPHHILANSVSQMFGPTYASTMAHINGRGFVNYPRVTTRDIEPTSSRQYLNAQTLADVLLYPNGSADSSVNSVRFATPRLAVAELHVGVLRALNDTVYDLRLLDVERWAESASPLMARNIIGKTQPPIMIIPQDYYCFTKAKTEAEAGMNGESNVNHPILETYSQIPWTYVGGSSGKSCFHHSPVHDYGVTHSNPIEAALSAYGRDVLSNTAENASIDMSEERRRQYCMQELFTDNHAFEEIQASNLWRLHEVEVTVTQDVRFRNTLLQYHKEEVAYARYILDTYQQQQNQNGGGSGGGNEEEDNIPLFPNPNVMSIPLDIPMFDVRVCASITQSQKHFWNLASFHCMFDTSQTMIQLSDENNNTSQKMRDLQLIGTKVLPSSNIIHGIKNIYDATDLSSSLSIELEVEIPQFLDMSDLSITHSFTSGHTYQPHFTPVDLSRLPEPPWPLVFPYNHAITSMGSISIEESSESNIPHIVHWMSDKEEENLFRRIEYQAETGYDLFQINDSSSSGSQPQSHSDLNYNYEFDKMVMGEFRYRFQPITGIVEPSSSSSSSLLSNFVNGHPEYITDRYDFSQHTIQSSYFNVFPLRPLNLLLENPEMCAPIQIGMKVRPSISYISLIKRFLDHMESEAAPLDVSFPSIQKQRDSISYMRNQSHLISNYDSFVSQLGSFQISIDCISQTVKRL